MNTEYLFPDLSSAFDARSPENREAFWSYLAVTRPDEVAALRELNEALVLDLHAEAFRRHRWGQALSRFLGTSDDMPVVRQSDFTLLG